MSKYRITLYKGYYFVQKRAFYFFWEYCWFDEYDKHIFKTKDQALKFIESDGPIIKEQKVYYYV